MPNLVDIVEVAEALESKAVYLASDRCVVVRNRHASCAKCADACPTGSVFAANNVLELDGEGCVACGACTTVCPVEALIPLRPLDEDLASSVASAVAATGGKAVFACARIASKRLADPAKYAEVPCLARMEESVLLGLAARGVEGGIGMEYSLMQLLQFRVGYHGGESRLYYPDYFSLGVGVRFMHLCFDAGYTVAKKASPMHNAYSFTIGLDF